MCQYTWGKKEGIPYPPHSFSCLCLTFVDIYAKRQTNLFFCCIVRMYAVCLYKAEGVSFIYLLSAKVKDGMGQNSTN
jgi:hypothetical protein